jgi:transcriptional regulator with XRE-family HTH domain
MLVTRNVDLGRRIREQRQRAGLTGQRLAEDAQISPGFLSEVERGLAEISVERLQRIAKVLGVEVGALLGEKTHGNTDPAELRLPRALQEAAEGLKLSFKNTITLFNAKQSLVARRSSTEDVEWSKLDWENFYKKVKAYLDE